MTTRMLLVAACITTLVASVPAEDDTAAPAPHAALIDIDGAIGPAVSGYVDKARLAAIASGARVIVLRIDTPGGLDTSMRDIVKSILNSPVPVAAFVAPGGARAASAGTYILYAAHIAAMAPATNLGAATPVPVGGGAGGGAPAAPEPSAAPPATGTQDAKGAPEAVRDRDPAAPEQAMRKKVVNDAVAYIRSLAEKRGRNAEWAEEAVREGVSLSATAALEKHVIDLIADDVPDLLNKIDGRAVETTSGTITLGTKGLPVRAYEPDWRSRLLGVITNPTIAYMLMLAGIYGLLLEGYSPGAVLPGVTGAICLLLALFAFQLLPVNYVGLALILLGVILLISETLVPSFGALGFGGITAFVIGSIMLMDTEVPGYGVNLGVIAGIAISAAGLLVLMLTLLYRSRHAPPSTGKAVAIGHTVVVTEFADGSGWAKLGGERWQIACAQFLAPGDRARVVRVQGLTLQVAPEDSMRKELRHAQ